MLYDYVAKFETEIETSVFPKDIEDLLSPFGGFPVQKQLINTKIVASAAPLITDDNREEICQIQNDAYRKGLEDNKFQEKLNYKIRVGKTRFVGYESISEHRDNKDNNVNSIVDKLDAIVDSETE